MSALLVEAFVYDTLTREPYAPRLTEKTTGITENDLINRQFSMRWELSDERKKHIWKADEVTSTCYHGYVHTVSSPQNVGDPDPKNPNYDRYR